MTDKDADIAIIIRSKMPDAKPEDFIRYGTNRGKQRYLHKPSGRKFIANDALPGRRVPARVVGDAVTAFHDGLSYRDLQRRIESQHGFTPSTATLYEWTRGAIQQAKELLDGFKAKTGDTWVADEMVLDIDGEKIWLWNVMDAKTRYLLATHLSKTRTIKDAEALFRRAKARSATTPKEVITDGLASYREGVERVFGGDTKHLVSKGIRSSELNNNLAERLHGTIRERNKVMRGLESKDTADIVMDGFRIHYNHVKPHHALRGRTPAKAAGLPIAFKDWVAIASMHDSTKDGLRDTTMEAKPLKAQRPRHKTFSMGRRRF